MQIEATESLTDIQTDGVTMAVDTRRSEESILLTATLMEDSLDLRGFRMAFNDNEVDEEAATVSLGAYSEIGLYKGPHVQKFQFSAEQCLILMMAISSPSNCGYPRCD